MTTMLSAAAKTQAAATPLTQRIEAPRPRTERRNAAPRGKLKRVDNRGKSTQNCKLDIGVPAANAL